MIKFDENKFSFICSKPWFNLFRWLQEFGGNNNWSIFNKNSRKLIFKLKKLIISTKKWFIDPETVRNLFNIFPYIACVSISRAVRTIKATKFYACSNINKIEFKVQTETFESNSFDICKWIRISFNHQINWLFCL